MAKSKKLQSYSVVMFELLDVLNNGKEMRIPFSSKEEANAFRFDFYGFRAAAAAEGADEIVRKANPIKARVAKAENGWEIVFAHVDQSGVPASVLHAIAQAQAELLNEEMITLPPPQVPSEPLGKPIDHMEAYMERMYGDVASKNGVQTKGEGK